MKLFLNKRMGAVIVVVLAAFLPMRLAHAGVLDALISMTANTVAKIIMSITVPIGFVASLIFRLAGVLIEWALGMNSIILDLDKNFFLKTGWSTVLNLADLALILALIVIAFATMLNYESYGIKKALPRLIIIALLVNFSLVIPGVLMDISGMLTAFFVDQSGMADGGISTALASAFDISKMFEAKPGVDVKIPSAAAALSTAVLIPLASVIFSIIFTIIASVILFTIAAMLVTRYIKLSFLLVFSPLIFVSWIFPSTKKYWTKWWDDFVRWTMFAPVMMFFIWLSIASLRQSATAVSGIEGSAALASLNSGLTFQAGALINMLMASGILMGSLIAANSISISGSKGGKDMISSMTGWSKDRLEKMGKGAQRETERAGRRAVARPVAAVGRGAAALRKYEGEKGGALGLVAGVAGRAGEKMTERQKAVLNKTFEDKFKTMSDDDLAMRYATMGRDEKLFAAQRLIKNGKFNKIDGQVLERDISDEAVKAAFEQHGGEKAYEDFTKAAGRNKEMIDAKATEKKNAVEIRNVETQMTVKEAEIAKAPSEAVRQQKTAELDALKETKKTLTGNYKEAAKNFYAGFSKKEREALGSKFYDESQYAEEAIASMLLNDPGSLAAITRGIGRGPDMRKFMDKTEKIGLEVKKDVIDNIQKAKGADIAKATDVELLEVMKELKATKDDIEAAKAYDTATILEWIKSEDAKTYKKIGGGRLATDLEAQMKMLHSRDNAEFLEMHDQHEDYQHMMSMQESMRKSGASRLYAASKEEEAKA